MIIHEEPSPNSVSSPVSTAKDSRCYTVEDLMEMLLLSRPTVYRLLKQNEFRWFKVSGAYRISKASFEAWLNDGTVERNPAVCTDSVEVVCLLENRRTRPGKRNSGRV